MAASTVLANALHSHLSVFQSLGPYQMRQGASVRASQSSLMVNSSRKSRRSPLLVDPGQGAKSKGRPLSQVSQPVPLCPYPSGPQEHSGHGTTLASQTSPPGPALAYQLSGSAGRPLGTPTHCPRYNVMVERGALDSNRPTLSSCVTSGKQHISEPQFPICKKWIIIAST